MKKLALFGVLSPWIALLLIPCGYATMDDTVVPENSYTENRATFAFRNTIPINLKDQTEIIVRV